MVFKSDFMMMNGDLPSGKLSHNYGESPFSMGKSTLSMAMFNSKLLVCQKGTMEMLPIHWDCRGISILLIDWEIYLESS